ncbi:MAG: hypothetical protein WBX49_01840 [Candidatus Deferrimicrobiaceae bacterium]
MKKGLLFSVCFVAMAALLTAGVSVAAEKGHGSMPGMHGESKMEGHGMMKMGDKVFEGKVGSFHGEARLVDMKVQMEKAKASGMKMEGMMKNTHHLSLMLSDPHTKKAVTEGKGSVTVTGPDKKKATTDFMVMQGHFGADVAIDKPGQYNFDVVIESGGKKGTASFAQEIK